MKKFFILITVLLTILAIGIIPVSGAKKRRRRGKKPKKKQEKKIKKRGLALKNRISRERDLEVKPNRHNLMNCSECHISVPQPGEKSASKEAPLLTDTEEQLCFRCHPPESEVHPSSLFPSEQVAMRLSPEIFPYGKLESEKGRVICSTCHDVHLEMATNLLLRGLPIKEGDSSARFPNMGAFCKSCHGEEITQLSPHYGNEIKNLCRFCHLTSPDQAENIYKTLSSNIIRTCSFCHETSKDVHYLKVNPFADKEFQGKIPTSLPLVQGAYTCITCHFSHQGDGNPQLLRSAYIDFAVLSKRIRPHFTKVFCLSCHDKKPEPGQPVTFKFDGDMVKMCNWCHDSNFARGFLHRVNHTPPTEADVKRYKFVHFNYEVFKLNKDGRVDCATCHQRECEQTEEKTGKRFLRGGPYKRTTDVCFQCHVEAVFRGMDPHKGQLNDDGDPVVEKCLFCHAGDPSREVEGMRQIDFVAQIRLLCMRCHDEYDHPGTNIRTGRGTNHLAPIKVGGDPETHMKPLKDIPLDILPLAKGNMMTCGTCHNPHEPGVLEGKAAMGAGARQRHRLGIMKGEMCEACHTF